MKKSAGGNARLAAVALLASVLDEGNNLGEEDQALNDLQPRDRAFARHLAYGALRWLSALQWLAGGLLNKPLKQKDRDIQRLVLLGLFQLWKDGDAPHAAINETAECARLAGKPWAVGLINAVLRRFQREQQARIAALEKTEERLAHPRWLLAMLKHDWPDNWESMAEANNEAPPLWLRLNAQQDPEASIDRLQKDGLHCQRHPLLTTALRVDPPRSVDRLPGFSEGCFSVQDPAAQLAAGLLAPLPGQRVLDACAAPGGKTCHLLEFQPEVEVLAVDRSARRLKQVAENVQRLHLENGQHVTLSAQDAAQPETWWDKKPFDRILLDAPCTATGVIRRHPEIKWLRQPGQVDEAVLLQRTLLDRLWPLLDTGGMLLYATCSVLEQENSGQVKAFLQRHQDAEPISFDAEWGRNMNPGRQILPGEHGMDGFYYALLRKAR